jgi:hypothetical protein
MLCCPDIHENLYWYLDSIGNYLNYFHSYAPASDGGWSSTQTITLFSFNGQETIIPIEKNVPLAQGIPGVSLILNNPAVSLSRITVFSAQKGVVGFNLYDIQGRRAANRFSRQVTPGFNYVQTPSVSLPNGLYIIKSTINGRSSTFKLVISR